MTRANRRRGREVLELVDDRGRPDPFTEVEARDESRPTESFEAFYTRELPRLLVLARALAGDLAAEDIAQESMLVAYRRWSHITTLTSPVGYVRGICAHQAVSVARRRLAERRALRRYASDKVADLEMLPSDSERFWTEVRRLPRRQAQVSALFYALDLSVADVAATLGCAEGTVKAHLSRAREQLARRLESSQEPS
jgi:RNA polymerase sigma-70 factor, ECF subfamily